MPDQRSLPPKPRFRRTWPQRLLISGNVLLVVLALTGAGALWYGKERVNDIKRVRLPQVSIVNSPISHQGGDVLTPGTDVSSGTTTTVADDPGSITAQNFLIVGADGRGCNSTNPQYAGAYGPVGGDRSDTIMLLRIMPDQNTVAILSFPRDLWVKVPGANRNDKINSTFRKDDPKLLIQTLALNFGVPVDHYVQIDFCAFKAIVDTLGGVKVPFATPARDNFTGLRIDNPGCVAFDGDAALAYARSRHYQYFDGRVWKGDPTSDLGRIKRQQDFIKRAAQKALDKGIKNPAIAKGLIDAVIGNVVIDGDLTLQNVYKLANRLSSLNPAEAHTFTIQSYGRMVGDAAVELFDVKNPYNAVVLKVFSGKATLADTEAAASGNGSAGEVSTIAPLPTTTTSTTTTAPSTGSTVRGGRTTTSTPPTTVPAVTVPTTIPIGVTPPDDPTCR